MESKKLKSKAVQNVSTTNPPTIWVHNIIINPLITKRNNPKVTKVNGKVNTTITGLMNTLMTPKTNATISEVVKLCTCTPEMR